MRITSRAAVIHGPVKALESFLNARDQHAGEDPFIPRASDGRLCPARIRTRGHNGTTPDSRRLAARV